MTTSNQTHFSRLMLLTLAVITFLSLFDLGYRKLANPDEGRYSVLAQHMAVSGDFVTPRLNGLKYFEKPPMQYWATAAAFKVFGESEWSARLYTSICALLCLCLVGYTGARIFNRDVGLYSVLALAACPYFMALGQIVTLDMGLTFWTTLSLCSFMISQSPRGGRDEHPPWVWLAWAAAAGAVLSKGLIGVVFPAATVFFYSVFCRDLSLIKKLVSRTWIIGIILFFVLVTPWFILVGERNPEFYQFFFIHEHWQRFFSNTHRRVAPWWTFIAILMAGAAPWAFMLLQSIWRGFNLRGNGEADFYHASKGLPFSPLKFALIWCGFIMLFFSMSGSKLPAYILPIFPPLAIVIGYYLSTTPAKNLAKYLWPLPLLAVIGGVWAYVAPEQKAQDALTLTLYKQYSVILMGACGVIFISTLAAIFMFMRDTEKLKRAAAIAVTVASLVLIHLLNYGYEKISPLQSGYQAAQAALPYLTPQARFYGVKMYDQSMPFYTKRSMHLIQYIDEFETGQKAEPQLYTPKLESFAALWAQPGPAVAVMQDGIYADLTAEGVPMKLIHSDPRRYVVIKPPHLP